MIMEVILREDVKSLGKAGQLVRVKPGYARNFLLPRKLAEPATPARVAELEKVQAHRAKHEAQTFDHARGNRDDVLERTADFDTDDVSRRV